MAYGAKKSMKKPTKKMAKRKADSGLTPSKIKRRGMVKKRK